MKQEMKLKSFFHQSNYKKSQLQLYKLDKQMNK